MVFFYVSDNGLASPSAMPCLNLDLIAPPSKPPKPGSRKRPVTDHAAQQQHSLPLLNKVTTQQLADQPEAHQCLLLYEGFVHIMRLTSRLAMLAALDTHVSAAHHLEAFMCQAI